MSKINLKATSPSGKIYIGDPCYVMKRDLYDKLFDKMNWNVPGGCSIETEVLPGVFACAGTTKHGDGWYETGSVDSGTIGAVPIEACDQDKLFPKKEPGKFSFPEYMIWDTNEVNLEYGTDSCQFFFYSDFDNIVVDTNEGAYEDYEDEELDEAKVDNRRRVREHFDIFVKAEQKIQDIVDDLQSGSPTFSKKHERSTIREIWESLSTGRSWARFYAWLNETNSPLVELVVDEDVPNYSDVDNIVVDTDLDDLDEAVEEKRSLRRFRENFVKAEYYDDNNKKIEFTLKDNESVLEVKLGRQVFEFKKSQLFSFLLDLKNAFNTMKDW